MKKIVFILTFFLSISFTVSCFARNLYFPNPCRVEFSKPKKDQQFIMTPNTLSVTYKGKCSTDEDTFEAWIDLGYENQQNITNSFSYNRPFWQSDSIRLPQGDRQILAAAELSTPRHASLEHTGLVDITVLPAPNGEIRIMPLGDSITEGFIGPGYRDRLCTDLISDDFNIRFVGSQPADNSDNDDRCYYHEGHQRMPAEQMIDDNQDDPSGPLKSWLDDSEPHIILLHIGTNDIREALQNDTKPNIEAIVNKVDDILNAIDHYNLETVVFLARIIKSTDENFSFFVEKYNRHLEKMARRRIEELHDRIIIVDMERSAGLNYELQVGGGDFLDELHPSFLPGRGYDKMADVWFDWLESFLPRQQRTGFNFDRYLDKAN